ncbi:hypothetical protein GGS23DRAFT_160215 [Durotheca rogersii]|uniref:uncharacterized protein n=1 Tax=Durotheca rogersii TaxID=419775 RepID=UPI0022210A28|nr:uncharacterized protein GGS23DRAFT_160215 [Durotheca rogersii]KAI5861258.1 hypothetical protein GGS23DRAFT_160215 [Durotheca rogersii]
MLRIQITSTTPPDGTHANRPLKTNIASPFLELRQLYATLTMDGVSAAAARKRNRSRMRRGPGFWHPPSPRWLGEGARCLASVIQLSPSCW